MTSSEVIGKYTIRYTIEVPFSFIYRPFELHSTHNTR